MSAQHWINYEGTMGWDLLPHPGQGLITSEVLAGFLPHHHDSSSLHRIHSNAYNKPEGGGCHIKLTEMAFAMPFLKPHDICKYAREDCVATRSCQDAVK